MDPITVTRLVRDRTLDLQRTADQARQERSLRGTPAPAPVAPPTQPAEVRRSPTKAGSSPVERAT